MTAEPGKSKADNDSESKDEPVNGSGADSGKIAQATKTAGGVSGDGAVSMSGGVATGQSNGGTSNGSAGKKVVAAGTPREEARVNVPLAKSSDVTQVDGVKPVTDSPAEKDKSADVGTTAGSVSGTAGAGAAGMGTTSSASGQTATSAVGSAHPASPATSKPSPLSPAQSMGRSAGAAPAFGSGQPIGSGSSSPGTTQMAGTAATDSGSGKAAAQSGASSGKNPRKAHLQLARLEPWSVMKFSFVMSLVAFIVLLVAVVVLWVVLSGLGVFDAISSTVNDLTRDQGDTTGALDAASWFAFTRVFGYTVLVGAVNVLLITALSTVGSVMYNTAADLVGGVEVTLKEAE